MFNLFKKDKEPQNLDQVLKQFQSLKKEVAAISRGLEKLKEENRFSLKKIALVRYNPFSEVGSDQSFSLVLLDEDNNGIVITSLFSRDGNRVYGKAIKNGTSQYSLSDEEKKVISKAIKNEQ